MIHKFLCKLYMPLFRCSRAPDDDGKAILVLAVPFLFFSLDYRGEAIMLINLRIILFNNSRNFAYYYAHRFYPFSKIIMLDLLLMVLETANDMYSYYQLNDLYLKYKYILIAIFGNSLLKNKNTLIKFL